MKSKQRPVVIADQWNDTRTTHPAFGMISANRIHTTGITLHGSDLVHQEYIEINIFEGEMVEQDGKIRYTKGRRRPIAAVALSTAQWANMISSFGLGDGVPCTLESVRYGELVELPMIEPIETTRERFDRQIREAVSNEVNKLNERMNELAALVHKGKAGKKELAEFARALASTVNNMPSNLAMTTELMQEAMDHVVAAGKSELEATALGVASRLGIKEISRLVQLEDKSNGDSEK